VFKKIINSTSLKLNLIANFVGNGWSALISILFVPLYLKYIGAEGYGLIGIFASLQVVLSLLDSGLSTTLNKELARLSALANAQQQMRNLVKTLGGVYWVVAITAGIIALCLSPLIANYWVHPKDLAIQTVTYSFVLLSISIIFQFPSGFYNGGLLGLQRQVIFNILRVLFATLKSLGALMILIYVSNSVLAFFGWTLIVNILQAFTYKYTLWYYLPKTSSKAIFDKGELKSIWRFAAGLTAIGLTGILLTQVDSVVLSKILPLKQFGYYTLSFTIGSITYMIVGPVSQSYFPKFSVLLTEGKLEELKKTYHQGCQMVTLLVLPFALFLSLFSKELLLIWTHNSATVQNTWKITSVVTLAVAIHCLMFIPYMLCLTYSYTKLALYTNIIILIVLIPSTIFSAIHYGGLGGAMCWLTINVIYLLVSPTMMHRFILKGEAFNWYWSDTIKPIIGCIIVFLLMRFYISSNNFNTFLLITLLILTGIIGFILTLLSSAELKDNILGKIRGQLKRVKIANK
jgi:O-antigen/teichoic acid export membrane protein